MVFVQKLLYYVIKTWYCDEENTVKLWYVSKNHGICQKTKVLCAKAWFCDEIKNTVKHGICPKTMILCENSIWIHMCKNTEDYASF